MNELTLADVKSFHAELLSVVTAGLPIVLGPQKQFRSASSIDALREELGKFETGAAVAQVEGRSVEKFLGILQSEFPNYTSALLLWRDTSYSAQAFDLVVSPAMAGEQRRGRRRVALVRPVVWLVVGCGALWFVFSTVIPLFHSICLQLELEPGPALALILVLSKWYYVWLPCLALIFVAIYFTANSLRLRSMFGREQELGDSLLKANVHECLAATAEQEIADRNEPGSARGRIIRFVAPDLSGSTSLPPLLAWATTDDMNAEGGAESISKLRIAANLYRFVGRTTEHELTAFRGSSIITLIGGIFTLLIALSIFLPLIEFLFAMTLSGSK